MIGLTKSAAMNGARLGVRVNTIAPGVIATPLLSFLEEGSTGEGPDMRAFLENLVPLGRLGESSEVASLVAFLLSDEASYLTGNTILIDGGIFVDNHTLRLDLATRTAFSPAAGKRSITSGSWPGTSTPSVAASTS